MTEVEREEFSVCQFFEAGFHEYVRRYVSASEAVKVFHRYCRSVAAQRGIVVRVIITDGGDSTVAEWKYGEGRTWPRGAAEKPVGRWNGT